MQTVRIKSLSKDPVEGKCSHSKNCSTGQVQNANEAVKISGHRLSGAITSGFEDHRRKDSLSIKTWAHAGGPKRCTPSPRNLLVRLADTPASHCQKECQ